MKAMVVAGLVLLAGCATSPANLQRPENAVSFTLPQPYQLTLKRIVDTDTECQGGGLMLIGQLINDVQHYPDLREAKIVQGAQGVGRQIYQVIVVREPPQGGTEVVLYSKAHREDRLARLRRWATGDASCEF